MTRLAPPLTLIAALCVGGCNTAPIVPPSDQVILSQGETSLELAYNTAATLYLQKIGDGSLASSDKATAKAILQKWLAALHLLRTAEKAGDATTISAQLAAIPVLASQAMAILKPGA